MKLTSTLKKLVNSYPITLIFILLLLSSITAIFIQSHVYAMSQKDNTPGCNCQQTGTCPTSPPSDYLLCNQSASLECSCEHTLPIIYCPNTTNIYECVGEKGCGNPCVPADCPGCPSCGCICSGSGCVIMSIEAGNSCYYPNCSTCKIKKKVVL